MSALEEMCISYYFKQLVYRAAVTRTTQIDMTSCLVGQFGPTVASKAVRSAIVVFAIRALRERINVVVNEGDELRYLGQVFRYTQAVIKDNKFLDLVYTLQIHGALGSSIEAMATHVVGFLLSLDRLLSTIAFNSTEWQVVLFMNVMTAQGLLSRYRSSRKPHQSQHRYRVAEAAIALVAPTLLWSLSLLERNSECCCSGSLRLSSRLAFREAGITCSDLGKIQGRRC